MCGGGGWIIFQWNYPVILLCYIYNLNRQQQDEKVFRSAREKDIFLSPSEAKPLLRVKKAAWFLIPLLLFGGAILVGVNQDQQQREQRLERERNENRREKVMQWERIEEFNEGERIKR